MNESVWASVLYTTAQIWACRAFEPLQLVYSTWEGGKTWGSGRVNALTVHWCLGWCGHSVCTVCCLQRKWLLISVCACGCERFLGKSNALRSWRCYIGTGESARTAAINNQCRTFNFELNVCTIYRNVYWPSCRLDTFLILWEVNFVLKCSSVSVSVCRVLWHAGEDAGEITSILCIILVLFCFSISFLFATGDGTLIHQT